jgi:hypothetical protein
MATKPRDYLVTATARSAGTDPVKPDFARDTGRRGRKAAQEPSSCCTAKERETCCEPRDRAGCCGEPASPTCGCR